MRNRMKTVLLFFFTVLFSVSCTSNTSVTVKSWEDVETDTFNKKIGKAYDDGLDWVGRPELYVFNLFELSDLKKISYEFSADNIETPVNIEINLIRDGFADDSVRGDIQRIKLRKNNEGRWEIVSIKRAVSCWRNEGPAYSSEACP